MGVITDRIPKISKQTLKENKKDIAAVAVGLTATAVVITQRKRIKKFSKKKSNQLVTSLVSLF